MQDNDQTKEIDQVLDEPKKSSSQQLPGRGKALFVAAGIVLFSALSAGGIWAYENYLSKTSSITTRSEVKNDGNLVVTKEEENIASLVDKVAPSVVSITTKNGMSEGAGTGMIVSADGYILTNKHVVKGASHVNVILSDGTTYEKVSVVGFDPLNDLAFLKIQNVSNLHAAELGDSSSLRVGQKVVAIGNSLGQYQNTVTSGIVSGKGRPVLAGEGEDTENLVDLIQTDAAINPGNSGGPLLNLQGQVIGINTAIAQDAQGIGFSIPIGAAKGLLKGVLAGNGIKRSYLGVNYLSITPQVAKQYELSVDKGAYVFAASRQKAIQAGSPASQVGIKEKDIITKIGPIAVGDGGGVSTLLAEYAPGDTIEVTVLRGSETKVFTVVLGDYSS